MEILPAIIAKTFEEITEQVDQVKNFAQIIHLDICDGIFAKNKTWPYVGDDGEYKRLAGEHLGLPFWDDLDYEIHLMVENPDDVINEWIVTGARRIVVHIESAKNIENISAICIAAEVELILAIKPNTELRKLTPFIPQINGVQVMGSDKLGVHGVELNTDTYNRVEELRNSYKDLPISVDIGVHEDTADILVQSGATRLVVGSMLFDSTDIEDTYNTLMKL